MKKIATIIFILSLVFAFCTFSAFAESQYHSFGVNPMVPGGLTIPASGSEWQIVPQNIPNVRMWGRSGESSVKIFPAGEIVEAHQEQVAGQTMWVATRAKCCGNTVAGLFWSVSQAQVQQQQIVVNVSPTIIFQQPTQPPDYTIYGNPKIMGATYNPAEYVLIGGIQKKTVTWSSNNTTFAPNITNGNINNSSQGGSSNAQGGAGGQGGQGGAGGNNGAITIDNTNSQTQTQQQQQQQQQDSTNNNSNSNNNNNENNNSNSNNNNNSNQNNNNNANSNANNNQ